MADSTIPEKSGIHITGKDSGWPVGNVAGEPPHTKDGSGVDNLPKAQSISGGLVTDSGTNEVQSVKVQATGGTFTLTFGGKTTAAIAYNATAAAFRKALEALESVGKGNVSVTGGPGDEGGTKPYVVTFEGALADKNVGTITADATALTGGEHKVTITTTSAGAPL